MTASMLDLDEVVQRAATGDIWLFRGRTIADRAIQTVTNSPVNHVGMVVALDDLPPLLWHAELGRSLPDVWTGRRQRGVQLHLLRDAVTTWCARYGQRAWVRQLEGKLERVHEDRLMEVIERYDGRAFPTSVGLMRGWVVGRFRRPTKLETVYCAELVATTYQHMGLLPSRRPASWYDPGAFWSGDRIELVAPFRLASELLVAPRAPEHERATEHEAVAVDVCSEIEIARPRAEVAAYACDPGNATAWYENITRADPRTPPPLAAGSRIEFTARFLGRELTYTYEVSELVPGERFVMSTAEGPFPMQTTYTWEDAPGAATRMTLRNRGAPSGFARVTAPAMARAMKRANAKDLRRLKAILERAPGS